MVVRGTIRAWGNSLAVRIPRIVSEELGIKENSSISMSVREGLLVIRPTKGHRKSLDKMLKQISANNLPATKEAFGQAVGRESS